MNIIFDHRAGLGKITQMDFIYAPCAAYPLPSEELQAVESGARIVGRFFWPVEEFDTLLDQAIRIIVTKIMPGTSSEALRNELEAMI